MFVTMFVDELQYGLLSKSFTHGRIKTIHEFHYNTMNIIKMAAYFICIQGMNLILYRGKVISCLCIYRENS